MERIQYSAFIGSLKKYELNSLVEDLKKLVTNHRWEEEENVRNIQIYPIPEISRKTRIEINFREGKLDIFRGETESPSGKRVEVL